MPLLMLGQGRLLTGANQTVWTGALLVAAVVMFGVMPLGAYMLLLATEKVVVLPGRLAVRHLGHSYSIPLANIERVGLNRGSSYKLWLPDTLVLGDDHSAPVTTVGVFSRHAQLRLYRAVLSQSRARAVQDVSRFLPYTWRYGAPIYWERDAAGGFVPGRPGKLVHVKGSRATAGETGPRHDSWQKH